MSGSSEKKKRKAAPETPPKKPVTLKDLAQASERVVACAVAHERVIAETEAVRRQSLTRYQAAENEWKALTARAKAQEQK